MVGGCFVVALLGLSLARAAAPGRTVKTLVVIDAGDPVCSDEVAGDPSSDVQRVTETVCHVDVESQLLDFCDGDSLGTKRVSFENETDLDLEVTFWAFYWVSDAGCPIDEASSYGVVNDEGDSITVPAGRRAGFQIPRSRSAQAYVAWTLAGGEAAVQVCHAGRVTLSVPPQVVRAHLAHEGDYLGPCVDAD